MAKNGRPPKTSRSRAAARAAAASGIPRHFFSKWIPDTRPTLTRRCDFPECSGVGEYRAPIAPTFEESNPLHSDGAARRFFWFCLDHVKQYNESWDYYAGLSAEEMEEAVRFDGVWNRPSWPMGKNMEQKLRQAFDAAFGEDLGTTEQAYTAKPQPTLHRKAEIEALRELELEPPIDFSAIKKRYRILVKQHHPDLHGQESADEKIKRLNSAFTYLKTLYAEQEEEVS